MERSARGYFDLLNFSTSSYPYMSVGQPKRQKSKPPVRCPVEPTGWKPFVTRGVVAVSVDSVQAVTVRATKTKKTNWQHVVFTCASFPQK
jgi:hypothetical protein